MKELLMVFILWSLLACNTEKPVSDLPEQENEEMIQVSKNQFESSNFELGRAIFKTFQDTTHVFGSWKASNKDIHSIQSKVEGQIKRIYVSSGAVVKRGDPLFYIESTVLAKEKASLLRYNNAIKYAEKEVQRLKALVQDTLVPLKELTIAKQELEKVKRDQKSQEYLIKQWTGGDNSTDTEKGYTLRSPISGQLTSLNVNPGAYIEAHDVLSTILGKKEMMIEIPVWEKYLESTNIGDTISCYSGWNTEARYEAVLISKAPVQEQSARVIFLAQPLMNKDLPLPGTSCEVHLPLRKEQLWVVPNSAVIRKEDGYYLLRRGSGEEYEFIPEKVEIIRSDAGYTAIRNYKEVWNEDEILIKGGYFIF